jgi:sugar-specific transcriptional regulator TrmB
MPEHISHLQTLGLNAYESKAYIALLERNTLTASEIATLAGIPRARVYDTLQTLMVKGLCVYKPGKYKTYSAVSPAALRETSISIASTKIEGEIKTLEREQEKLRKLKDSISNKTEELIRELLPVYERGSSNSSPLEYIEIIKDPYQTHRKFLQLMNNAAHERLIFSKPPYSVPKELLTEQASLDLDPRRAGTLTRCIYEIPESKEETEWLILNIEEAVTHGEEARVATELPMKMAVFDEKIVMFALQDPTSRKISLTVQIIEHDALAKALKYLFEKVWAEAEDYHILKERRKNSTQP